VNEWTLLLWAMTGSRHQWPTPPARDPMPVVRQAPAATLSPEERAQLRQALQRFQPTGKVIWDPASKLYVPEQKPETTETPKPPARVKQ